MLGKHLRILLIYIFVAFALSFPLALNFASALPGVEGDAASYLWALGWARRALELQADLFHTDFIFYPLGGATQLLWAVSFIGVLSLPLQYAFGLLASHNLMWLAATVLTGYGMYLLAEEIIQKSEFKTRNSKALPFPVSRHLSLAPFTAGLIFAFAPLRLGYGLAFFNLFNTQFIPFYILFLLRAARQPNGKNIFFAGIFLGVNAYIDFQIAAFLALFSALYALYEFAAIASLWRGHLAVETASTRAQSRPFTSFRAGIPSAQGKPLLLFYSLSRTVSSIALLALLVAAPMLWMLANDFEIEGGNYIRVQKLEYSAARSYDAASFFVPHARSALYANVFPEIVGVNAGATIEDVGPLSPDRQAFAGYVVLALALVGTIKQWRAARFWFFIAATFALFSFGPTLHFFGQDTRLPLPYLALHEIPILNHIRIPMRYGVIVFVALAVLAGLGIQNSKIKILNSKFGLLLPALILLESATFPYPFQPNAIPRVYSDIAREAGDFTILEIPSFYWRYAAATEVYQAIHGKRILRAYSNRIAPGPAEYFSFRGTPIVVRSLRILEGFERGPLADAEIAEDRRARDKVLAFYDLRYAVVHKEWLKPDQAPAIDAYLREVLNARVVFEDASVTNYQLPRPPETNDTPLRIDLRENGGQMYAGRGWQFEYPPANWDGQFNFVWARGARSEIYFREERAAERVMNLRAYAASPQRMTVWLNGARVDEIALKSEWSDYRVVLPAPLMRGMNRVELKYEAELQETVGLTTIEIQ